MSLKPMSIETIHSGGILRSLNRKLQEVEKYFMESDPEGEVVLTMKITFSPSKINPDIVPITSKIGLKMPENVSGDVAKITNTGIVIENTSYDAREPGLFDINDVAQEMHKEFPNDTITVTKAQRN